MCSNVCDDFFPAYSLLIEDPEPCKEKGYVSTLYAGIKRCIPDKHIHLQTKTDYIAKLISRAEPELLGSRRERHAKTLEIAQEEVLTCIGNAKLLSASFLWFQNLKKLIYKTLIRLQKIHTSFVKFWKCSNTLM